MPKNTCQCRVHIKILENGGEYGRIRSGLVGLRCQIRICTFELGNVSRDHLSKGKPPPTGKCVLITLWVWE